MPTSSQPPVSPDPAVRKPPDDEPIPRAVADDHQLSRWGGWAGLGGAVLLVASVVVVVAAGLPDADDPETLTDFADIETARIAEHFFYLGSLVLFALHTLVLQRLLASAHRPAALFGAFIVELGLVAMAVSSLLHVSTTALADLYTAADTPPEDLRSIEHAWHGAQSVFDTMLLTGLLLVPIGLTLLGVAMRAAPTFGSRLGWVAIALGALGVVAATLEVVDTDLDSSAISLLVLVVLYVATGWRMLISARQ